MKQWLSCKSDFVARTTVTQCCSDACAKRFYKQKLRDTKIDNAILESQKKQKPQAFIRVEEINVNNARDLLTLKKAAFFMNVTELTMCRSILAGKIQSQKAGRKHLIPRIALMRFNK